ncbi:MAG: hypothetical protein JWN75_27 [Candidatus Saccharibacteria bacterium]|nr:hypothetical protein [Candidatus Saccharibacteria bacterium]
MRHRISTHKEIVDYNVLLLDASDDTLSRIMARALHVLPLPPTVSTRPCRQFDNGVEIRSAWAFGHDSKLRIARTAHFSMWLGTDESEMTASAKVFINEGVGEKSKLSIWMPSKPRLPTLDGHSYVSDENAFDAMDTIVEDMELGVMKYDESLLAQFHRSRAHTIIQKDNDDEAAQNAFNTANLADIEHKFSYGLEL